MQHLSSTLSLLAIPIHYPSGNIDKIAVHYYESEACRLQKTSTHGSYQLLTYYLQIYRARYDSFLLQGRNQ